MKEMKEENVLNVLMYLLQNHMQDSCKLNSDAHHIIHALEEAGFEPTLINEAIHWLETLIKDETKLICAPQATSTRVFTSEEIEEIDLDCLNFLLSLEQHGILTPETREIVIIQALALKSEFVDLGLLKWVTLMVLFNHPNCENALARMEFLVLDETHGGMH